MDPKAVIESYVDEVARRLPARLRRDVGLELRELLNEELASKAEEAGRPADEAMTLALLRSFGAPAEVAERYRPTGFEIIRHNESRLFAMLAAGGVLVQWTLSFPIEVLARGDGEFLIRLRDWWMGSGLHAFAWPGVMVCVMIVIGAFHLRPTEAEARVESMLAAERGVKPATPRAMLDPDRVDRRLFGFAVLAFVIGAIFYVMAPGLLQRIPQPARGVFLLDDGFLHLRAPWLLAPWAGQFVLFLVVLKDGRWRRPTRIADQILQLAGGVVIAWFVFGGPIFQLPQVDSFAKLIMGATTLVVIIVTIAKLRREQMRVGAPEVRS